MHSIRQKITMSDNGNNQIKKAIMIHTWVNLMKLLLPLTGFVFSVRQIGLMVETPKPFYLSAIHYMSVVTVLLLLMIAILQRGKFREYKRIYREAVQSEKLLRNRQQERSLFGSRKANFPKSSDLKLYEEAHYHFRAKLYATILSTMYIIILLLIHNLTPGLATLWAIPFALGVFAYSGKRENRYDRNINTESVSHIGMGITTIILKLGMISVAFIGANMLVTDQIGILDYIAFLTVSAGLSFPIPRLMRLSNLLSRFNKYLQEAEF